jgi:hypothetical protein
METPSSESPFQDLPEALVEEMLGEYKRLGTELSTSLEKMESTREQTRASLSKAGLLKRDSSILRSYSHPTTCGVDGAYAVERLLATDMAALAGVAVEGLSPPTEVRLWPQPHHLCKVLTVNHNDATGLVIRALMITMEMELAAKAPHDVVFMDGSLTTPVIHLNQALARLGEVPVELSQSLLGELGSALDNYKEILASKRTDKIYAGVPKYTSRNEVARKVGLPSYEDRSMLSFSLQGGELVGPLDMIETGEDWHFSGLPKELIGRGNEIISLIRDLNVLYYRPYEHFPALRIELAPSIARNQNRLSILLESLQLQSGAAAIMEPYPLYLADRMVKHLGTALPAIRRATTQEIATTTPLDVGRVFMAMHGYRTES